MPDKKKEVTSSPSSSTAKSKPKPQNKSPAPALHPTTAPPLSNPYTAATPSAKDAPSTKALASPPTAPIASTANLQETRSSASAATTTLDLLNQRLLAVRLKKEVEMRRRKVGYAHAKYKADAAIDRAKAETDEKKNVPILQLLSSSTKQFASPFQDSSAKFRLFKSVVATPPESNQDITKEKDAESGKQGKIQQPKVPETGTSATPTTASSPTKPVDSTSKPLLVPEAGKSKIAEPAQAGPSTKKPGPQSPPAATENKPKPTPTPVKPTPVTTTSSPQLAATAKLPVKDKTGITPPPAPVTNKSKDKDKAPIKKAVAPAETKRWSNASQISQASQVSYASLRSQATEVKESDDSVSPSDLKEADDDTQNDVWYYYSHPIAIQRASASRSNSTGRKKTNESILEVLRTVKDEQPQITIIPADESKVVEFEVRQWKEHRRTFLILFWIAFLMGILITGFTLANAIIYYLPKQSDKDAGTAFLMHADPMIITNTIIVGFGIIIFRRFPDVAKHILIRAHVTIFVVVYALLTWAYVVAYLWHEQVTQRPEHLYSVHGMMGTGIILLLLWEAVTGVIIIYKPNSWLVKYHGVGGMITFMLSGGVCVSGYSARAFMFTGPLYRATPLKTALSNTTGVLIIVFCCLVRYISTEFRFRRRSCPEWDTVFARKYNPVEDDNIDVPSQTLQKFVRMNLREAKRQR